MSYITAGIMLGFYAGFMPGPMLTLVLSETLKYGSRAGLQVAISPLLTDAPIIILSLLVVGQLGQQWEGLLGLLSWVGAIVLMWMGYEAIKTKHVSLVCLPEVGQASLKKGMLVNLLNPHPYLFWFTLGSPLIYRAAHTSLWLVLGFLFFFYLLLVGSKVALAIIVGRYRQFLNSMFYLYTVRFLGLILWVFAALLAWEGWQWLRTVVW